MTTLTTAEMLKYANLQMAAEALYRFKAKESPELLLPGDHYTGAIDQKILTDGNEHATRFTQTEAEKFAAQWTVVDHISNTTTGFSGTLFRDKNTNEYVISFRSTEFIDDVARDCVATNAMEIKAFGWAFGQISDMEAWYQSVKSKIDGPLSATGYSLGGHLATAFNLLRREELAQGPQPVSLDEVITFNGAGVGKVKTGTLGDIMADFNAMRADSASIATRFADPRLAALYNMLRVHFSDGHKPTAADYALLDSVSEDTLATESERMRFGMEKYMLKQAIDRIANLKNAVAYLGTVIDSKDGRPAAIPEQNIVQERFDYQVALLWAQNGKTEAMSLVAGGINTVFGKAYGEPRLDNQYDVVGRETTTKQTAMVADSQWHYGSNVDLFIEDQPLVRGTVIAATWDAYRDFGSMLPVNEYGQNDFGDTHSLVLIVDSLSVQNLLKTLAPAATQSQIESIFKLASNLRAQSVSGAQGKAEGDVLETVVNAIADTLLGEGGHTRLNGNPGGGTWAEVENQGDYTGRDALYRTLDSLTTALTAQGGTLKALAGQLKLEASSAALGDSARENFGAFLALYSLSPFVLRGRDDAAQTQLDAIEQAAWADVYSRWNEDRQLTPQERASADLNFTDRWLADRSAILGYWLSANTQNDTHVVDNGLNDTDRWIYADRRSAQTLTVDTGGIPTDGAGEKITHYVSFGAEEGDTLTGGDADDRLYGMAGNDTLTGGQGADHLEGNAGNDTLLGGTGDNTYVFTNGDGNDTIDDKNTEGQGRIRIGADTLTGGQEEIAGSDLWISQDKKYRYTLTTESDGSTTLLVLSREDRLIVKNFSEGKLGIHLGVAPVVVPPAPANAVVENPGRLITSSVGEAGSWSLTGHDSFNNIYAGSGDDLLQGLGGYDRLYGGTGDDRLFGSLVVDPTTALANAEQTAPWEAGDYLDGGAGNDLLVGTLSTYFLGGDGRDTLIGGGSMDIVYGDGRSYTDNAAIGGKPWAYDPTFVLDRRDGRSTFYVRFDEGGTEARYNRLSWLPETAGDDGGADLIYTGAGGDIAFGDYGRDRLDMGSGDDFGIGGHDDDIVDGGAGNDQLFGDFNWDAGEGPQGETESARLIRVGLAGEYHGNDILDGGAGNDFLLGCGDADELRGGDDCLSGGEGDDYLEGDASQLDPQFHGRDTLDGGEGNDALHGSAFFPKGGDFPRLAKRHEQAANECNTAHNDNAWRQAA